MRGDRGLTTTWSSSKILLSNDETKAYIVNDYGGFEIVDITNPANPSILGTYHNGNPRSRDVAISDDGTKVPVAMKISTW